MATLDTRYYAVLDPVTGDMTFWYLDKKGHIGTWPTRPRARYGPQLWSRLKREPGEHDYVVPEGLGSDERRTWISTWYETVQQPWKAAILADIERAPDEAMARFATIGFRCCICSRELGDAESRLSAIGPECRKGFPESLIVHLRQQVSRLAGSDQAQATTDRLNGP